MRFEIAEPNYDFAMDCLFKWMTNKITLKGLAWKNNEIAPHELLEFFTRLKLKADSGIKYSRTEIADREINRLNENNFNPEECINEILY